MVSAQEYGRLKTADGFRRDHIPVMLFALFICLASVSCAVYFWWKWQDNETLLFWKKEAAKKKLGLQ